MGLNRTWVVIGVHIVPRSVIASQGLGEVADVKHMWKGVGGGRERVFPNV